MAYPFLAIDIVVNPSGRALPIAKTVRPKYVVLRLVNTPIKVNKSTSKPEQNLVHNIPNTMLIKTIYMKYSGT